jgi:phage replication-related protein YjqB (UPF0714/DUF867 family)
MKEFNYEKMNSLYNNKSNETMEMIYIKGKSKVFLCAYHKGMWGEGVEV